ncbi:maleylpyruvate isomerase family mycothiol-dependent enzyme [Nocardioides sp. YIM 152315]|uniref:maleylpyruvate isomerase family mycothiol-dependent enzyme n=1 Tax=Nocardioides sp. YIM 152315 TaxID=3031760 RepID=UPI0023D9BF14|nr:maleylpyruvate isomerase family mycothiol-dependent enzyme [Nocardioides sp. YIM 152315]MDF1605816.1 maleylpyruvate isomerase family mycothiol-dependent enzyme [Nocardioides sp. YIM 152315]
MTQNLAQLRDALRTSHDRLVAVMGFPASPAADAAAYPEEWNVSDVLSHLGSGAEIFGLILTRLLAGEDAPTQDDFVAIWDKWNAKSPDEQVRDGLNADEDFVDLVDGIDSALDKVPAFGSVWPLTEFLGMRLQEHIVHTWDVEVASNRYATIPAEHLAFLLEQLPGIAPRSGREVKEAQKIVVRVVDPEAYLLVELGLVTAIESLENATNADLTMSAEAFVRLVFGRLAAIRPSDVAPDDERTASYLKSVFVGY